MEWCLYAWCLMGNHYRVLFPEYTYTRTGQRHVIMDAVGVRSFSYNEYMQLEMEHINPDGMIGNALYSMKVTPKYQGNGKSVRVTH